MPVRGDSSISRRPGVAQRPQRGLDVLHLVGDVVQPGPALGEELADRRVVVQRREQLDVVLADVEQRRLDALLGDRLAVHEREAVDVDVEVDRLLEVGRRRGRRGRCARTSAGSLDARRR